MKKTVKAAFAAALIAAGGTGAAQAENLLASNPQSFMDFFFEKGHPAQLSEDGVGDPYIEFRYDGTVMPLWFYGCEDNANCQSVQFYAAYGLEEPIALDRLNEWNGEERRYARAYVIEEGTLRLEMDVFTGADGITTRDFGSLLDIWIDRVVQFEDFIDW